MNTLSPGSISSGTLRDQDLLPTFLDALYRIDDLVARAQYAQIVITIPAHAWDDEDADWWTENGFNFVADLIDVLEEHAPEGYYFGTMEGDGAHFGVWAVQEQDWLD